MLAVPHERSAKFIIVNLDMVLAESPATPIELCLAKFDIEIVERQLTYCVRLLPAVFHLTQDVFTHRCVCKPIRLKASKINVVCPVYHMNFIHFLSYFWI